MSDAGSAGRVAQSACELPPPAGSGHRTMRAMVVSVQRPIADAPLEATELPVPDPAPGEVRVRVRACATCRTDLHVIEGDLPPRRLPIVPGHQVVGVVDAAGSGATRFRPGDRVGIAWLRSTCGALPILRDRAREPLRGLDLHGLDPRRRLRRVLLRAGGLRLRDPLVLRRRRRRRRSCARASSATARSGAARCRARRAARPSTASAHRPTSRSRWRVTGDAPSTS